MEMVTFILGNFLMLAWHLHAVRWLCGLFLLLLWQVGATRCCVALCVGLLLTHIQLEQRQSQRLPLRWERQTLSVEATIVSIPQRTAYGWRMQVKINRVNQHRLSRLWRLSTYDKHVQLQPGQTWRWQVRVKRPRGFANPGSFDYARYLFTRGISATGYIKTQRAQLVGQRWQDAPLASLRYAILHFFWRYYPQQSTWIGSLVFGDRQQITPQQQTLLRHTGTSHLMAISGLHIGMVATLIFQLSKWLITCFPRWCLRWPAPFWAAWVSLLFSLIYGSLTGLSVATQRALIMVVLMLFGTLSRQSISLGRRWCLAAAAVIAWDVTAALNVGFWLSFYAVGLFVLNQRLRRLRSTWWLDLWRTHLLMCIGLVPLASYFFQTIPLTSLFANLLAIPWMGTVVMPLMLLSALMSALSLSLTHWFLGLGNHAMALLLWYCQVLLSVLPWIWHHAQDSLTGVMLSVIATVLLLLPRCAPLRYLSVFYSIPFWWPSTSTLANGDFSLTQLDVGQGNATVIQTRHHTLVYDAGPRFSPTFDTGAMVVVPYLRAQHVAQVDTLIVSHGDNDHRGGVASLLRAYKPTHIFSSDQKHLLHWHGERCQAGQHWRWDGVEFTILHPDSKAVFHGTNNYSCVLKVNNRTSAALLPGDIERGAEQRLLQRQGKALQATVLVAPHHGSRTSSSEEFLHAVRPQWVLIGNGYRNKFHFPHPVVLRRFCDLGANVATTAKCGAIRVVFKHKEGIKSVHCWRQQLNPLWA